MGLTPSTLPLRVEADTAQRIAQVHQALRACGYELCRSCNVWKLLRRFARPQPIGATPTCTACAEADQVRP